jgi:peroxiredoxin
MTDVPALLSLARIVLAVLFALAGVAKFRDRPGTAQALADFGIPAVWSGPLSHALPVAEMVVAAALIPQATAIYGAGAALILLLGFIGAIAINLMRGRTPNCHCFGQLYSRPVGRGTLVRNGLLCAIAAFIVVAGWTDPGPSLGAWALPLSVFERAALAGGILALSLLGVQTALVARLARQHDRLLERLAPMETPNVTRPLDAGTSSAPVPANSAATGHPVGSIAPGFALPTLDGETMTLDGLRALGAPVMLFFSDPQCGPCAALLPRIGQWHRDHAGVLTVALIMRGTPDANRVKTAGSGVRHVLIQNDREVAGSYGVVGTPCAVLVRADGTVGSALAHGEAEISHLVAQATAHSTARPSPPAASRAAEFSLQDLDGRTVSLRQFRGQPAVLLFWNPDCGYCQRMLHDLKAWEARAKSDRVELLVIAGGSADANRALGLQSTIALDPGFTVGSKYGVQGTPSAVLIDANGELQGDVAVGGPAVLALLGQPETSAPVPEAPVERTTMGPRPAPLTTLPAGAKPLKQDCVEDELLPDGSMVLYNGCRQQLLTINPVAAFVWECCDGDHDIDAITAEVRDIFPTAQEAERDVRAVVDSLLQAGMVAPAAVQEMTPLSVASSVTL